MAAASSLASPAGIDVGRAGRRPPYAQKGAEAPIELLPIVTRLSPSDMKVGCGGGI